MKQKHFYDPKHGGCLRVFTTTQKQVSIIKGAYGNDEDSKGYWFAEVTHIPETIIDGQKYNLIVDFNLKKGLTHKQKLYAYMKNRKIKWEDGNVWIEMYA